MATLVVIGYADQGVAEDARKSVQEFEHELTVQTDQVASISRDIEGRYHAHISHGGTLASGGVDWGLFWGALFGLLFPVPVAGLPLGAEMGELRDCLSENKIGQAFQDQVRAQVKPGTSALFFVVVERAALDKAVGSLARYGGTTIKASLSDAGLERLRETLATTSPSMSTSAAIEASRQRD